MQGVSDEANIELLKDIIENSFPIFAPYEYESVLTPEHRRIGINEDYPIDFIEKILASSASDVLQNKSIDYTRKKYAEHFAREADPRSESRKDRELRGTCLLYFSSNSDSVVAARKKIRNKESIGEFISDATLIRIHYSMERAFAEADKGAMFEALVILRMVLEQFCWAITVRNLDDRDAVRNISATKSITNVSKTYPRLGRLNGWLSSHAHWAFDAHAKVVVADPGNVMLASPLFKACSYLALIVFTDLFVKIMQKEFCKFIDWTLVDAKLKFTGNKEFDFEKEFEAIEIMIKPFYRDVTRLSESK